MFREMRRKNQDFGRDVCMEILERGSTGVLALLGDGGYPYAVPLNYACMNGRIYFHCALEGHKVDAVRSCSKASFCVVDRDAVAPEEYSTHYRSVIAFGQVRMVEDDGLKMQALTAIGGKYVPGMEARTRSKAMDGLAGTGVIEFTPEHISGKESRALARQRREENA